MKMRFIDLGTVTPELSVHIDRRMFELRNNGCEDTLHIYSRDRPTISMGSNTPDDHLTDAVLKDGVTVVRRMSGGSAIYSDEWQMTYCITIGRGSVPNGRNESFEYICRGLMNALRIMGLSPIFKPVNDILVDGRKISGSAQYRNNSVLMQHGSLILRTPDVSRYINDVRPRSYNGLTSVEDVLGHIPPREDIVDAVVEGFSELMGDIHICDLTERERSDLGI